jgi:transcriptional regulator with XRE-family HTH domain
LKEHKKLNTLKKVIEFGQFLKMLRKDAGLTIKQLEGKSGISNAYISQIENGKRGIPSPEILERLSKHLNVDYEELLKRVGYLNRDVRNSIAHRNFNLLEDIDGFSTLLDSSINFMLKDIGKSKRDLNEVEKKIENGVVDFIKACNSTITGLDQINTIEEVLNHDLISNLSKDEKFLIIPMLYQLYEGVELRKKTKQKSNAKKIMLEIPYREIPILEHYQLHTNSLQSQEITGYSLLSKSELDAHDYFFWKVPHDYLLFSIKKGYKVLVMMQNDVVNGKIALASINEEEATLIKLYYEEDKIILQPANIEDPPRIINHDDIQIIGQIVKVEYHV